uniref:NADH dehydrogenase subunit 6 n=1 Tax=Daphnia tibetana TaxID=2172416 RepID=UPI002114E3A2|nr:NADH dehydrogenase subunit 6 [Daphnia tibetana]USH58534.1 NADH dehydrogenase subunit 6 [Daphnia tibetana]
MLIQTFMSIIMILMIGAFPGLTHPLGMGLVVLALTVFLAVMLGSFMTNFWLSYVLVLVLLGGLLVIFVYVSLLASNELFIKGVGIKFSGVGVLLGGALIWCNTELWSTQADSSIPSPARAGEGMDWVCSFYSEDLGMVTIFFMFYLLLTLIVVVNITKYDSSSLRVR